MLSVHAKPVLDRFESRVKGSYCGGILPLLVDLIAKPSVLIPRTKNESRRATLTSMCDPQKLK